MKNKKLLYFFGILVVAGLLAYSLISITSKQPSNPNTAATSTQTFVIPTPKGSVTVRDITRNPVQQVTDNTVIERNDSYSIVYYPNEKSFAITLLAAPLQKSREAAESKFLGDLGIDMAQACELKVSTFVPLEVDESFAGQDYGLSFCPSGRQF